MKEVRIILRKRASDHRGQKLLQPLLLAGLNWFRQKPRVDCESFSCHSCRLWITLAAFPCVDPVGHPRRRQSRAATAMVCCTHGLFVRAVPLIREHGWLSNVEKAPMSYS